MQKNQTISMLVSNAHLLESGLSAQCAFDIAGGVIGCSDNAHWYLRDTKGQIQHQHCKVSVIDSAFCIEDLSGGTYVNGSHMPLGKGASAKLEHNNEIVIGPYLVRVMFSQVGEDSALANNSIEQLFENEGLDLLSDGDFDASEREEQVETVSPIDPITALDSLLQDTKKEESLIEETPPILPHKNQTIIPKCETQSGQPQFTPQADNEYEMSASIRLKKILGFGRKDKDSKPKTSVERHHETQQATHLNISNSTYNVPEGLGMNDKALDLLEEEVAKSYQSHHDIQDRSLTNANHLLTGPMLTGLGVDVGNTHDMDKMHMLSEELGQSLQACVQGLLELNQQVVEGRFGMMNRNLQPIEDNPLRLGLSYEETIRTLYDADKSLVHLSAPAAISESLKSIRDHNVAMQHATAEALQQILHAFSPQVLLRRFQHYKRNSDAQHQSSESWAWEMYCHYYQELTSDRQKGFEKLFWEIFEQSYDKKIREKQLEL